MIPKSCNSLIPLINKEFEVEKCSTASRETGENALPPALLLVAMRELDMCVLEGDYS